MTDEKMFRANLKLNVVVEVQSHKRLIEHVDETSWDSYGSTPERAKQLLVDALNKRVEAAARSLKIASDKFEQAKAIRLA